MASLHELKKSTRAFDMVTGWLQGEENYQFARADAAGAFVSTRRRLGFLIEEEAPDKWKRFQLFGGNNGSGAASQALMKVVAGMRAAVVLEAEAKGWARAEAIVQSWRCLDALDPSADVDGRIVALGAATLGEALASVEYTYDNRQAAIRPGFVRAAGLAVAHLVSMEQRIGTMALPEPGYSSGEVIMLGGAPVQP